MKKTYIVRLTDDEREICLTVVKKLKGTSQKVRRANILLKADVNGPNECLIPITCRMIPRFR